ncbi:MAG: formylglycine-generating enzyme family protein [Methylococcaceae bacterium]|nr:MAG: formylglycine-generating enzyme family protein [Methylococcaceae bacterium]
MPLINYRHRGKWGLRPLGLLLGMMLPLHTAANPPPAIRQEIEAALAKEREQQGEIKRQVAQAEDRARQEINATEAGKQRLQQELQQLRAESAKLDAALQQRVQQLEQQIAEKQRQIETAEQRARLLEKYAIGHTIQDCDICPKLIVIARGEFDMGSPANEDGRDENEDDQAGAGGKPIKVRIDYALAVGQYEITRGEFARFARETKHNPEGGCYHWTGALELKPEYNWRNPGYEQGDNHPVTCVSWDDAQAYIQWLNGKSHQQYRLLSEAEWEYAARAGKGSRRFPWGDDPKYSELCAYANAADKTLQKKLGWSPVAPCSDQYVYTAPVGEAKPNPFGLHDLHGNVWEWVADCYKDSYQGTSNDGSPVEETGCSRRVVRGGSWGFVPRYLRSADRSGDSPDFRDDDGGFRLARMLP